MMTDERVQYFLRANTITVKEYLELVEEYFKKYKERQNEKLNNHIRDYWILIRKHVMPKGRAKNYYDFEFFYFPQFEQYPDLVNGKLSESANFWNAGESAIFEGNVNFDDVIFLSWFNLTFTEFQGQVSFKHTQFKGKTDFDSAVFSAFVSFHSCHFPEDCSFDGTEFNSFVQIANCDFERTCTFNSVRFNEANIQDIKPHQYHFLSFININFSRKVTFRRVHMKNIQLTQSDLSEVQFKECIWEISSRLHIKDEIVLDYSRDDYEALEEQYRQLKKNFDSNKDWELAGKAYVSEMEMRKKRLFIERNYLSWFIYWFYGFFGGYTQNYKKPIISLIGLIVISSIGYLFIEPNMIEALQRGIYGALPKLITVSESKEALFQGYWLIAFNIEGILGATFLTFFILALRKRFKQ